MTRAEFNKLLKFVEKTKRDSEGLSKRANREYKNAGCSATSQGTGDEGWASVFTMSGQSDGMYFVAEGLRQLLDTFKVEGEK